MSSTASLKETLLKRDGEEGYEVRVIQGDDYEQLKVTNTSSDNPDPRIGGTQIIFDSRFDTPEQVGEQEAFLNNL